MVLPTFKTHNITVVNTVSHDKTDWTTSSLDDPPVCTVPEALLPCLEAYPVSLVEIAINDDESMPSAEELSKLTFLFVDHYDIEDVDSKALWGVDSDGTVRLYIEAILGYFDPSKKYVYKHAAYEIVKLDGDFKIDPEQRLDPVISELRQYFFDTVNLQLSDPVTNDEAFGDDEPLSITFDHEIISFEKLCEDALVVGCNEKNSDIISITVYAATDDGENAYVETDYGATELTDFGVELFDAILEVHDPCGWSWSYNDGPVNRRSGYSRSPEAIHIERNTPTALEKAEAMVRIKDWIDRVAMKHAPKTAQAISESIR